MAFGGEISSYWSSWVFGGDPAFRAAHDGAFAYQKGESTPTQTSFVPAAPSAPTATPVSPTIDPKLEANALYGKPMALSALGYARIGSSPAPIVGPYINGGTVDFIVSFGVPADPDGTRVIYKIYLDNELAWSSAGGGTLPGDGTFTAEVFDFIFKPGRLDQTVCSLETEKFPGDENAYRPQMLLQIRGLNYARIMANTGKPCPYVACDIGDTTDGDPFDGINLGEGYERIANSPWVAWDAAKLVSVDVTDVTPGYLLKDNWNIIQLGQSITRSYRNLSLLQSDKLYLKDRGSNVTPDIVFDRDSIVGGDGPITITRTEPSKQPRELELFTIDPDQDYTAVPSLAKRARDPLTVSSAVGKEALTLPVIMDASTRQALVTFAQYYEENARKKVSLRVLIYGFRIEPGDLIALVNIADGIDSEVFKVVETSHFGDFTVGIQAEAILRCSLYGTVDPDFASVILLAHFDGSNGSTTFIDSSSYHATLTGNGNAEISTAQSRFGGASLFLEHHGINGDNILFSNIEFGTLSPTNTSPYTIEVFVRFDTVGILQYIIAQTGGAGLRHFALFQKSGSDELTWETSSNQIAWTHELNTSGANLVVDQMYFIVVDKDSTGTVRIYVDGVMFAKEAPADSAIGTLDGDHGVTIGSHGVLNSDSLDGYIDELRVTRGISRYGNVSGDASFTPPSSAFPDT